MEYLLALAWTVLCVAALMSAHAFMRWVEAYRDWVDKQ